MALTSRSLILKFLGAFLPTAVALRTNAGTTWLPLVKIPWEERPAAKTSSKACVLTPTHPDDFRNAKSMLLQMYAKAEDTVPIFLITSSEWEAGQWKDFIAKKSLDIPEHDVISLEEVLKGGSTGDKDYAANLSTTLLKIETADKNGCLLGTGKGRSIGSLKKLYGARHLGQAHGCDLVWVMDCDSQPMRNFSFAEAFDRAGKLWVGDGKQIRTAVAQGNLVAGLAANRRRSTDCTSNAQTITKQLLSPKVRSMDLRQNDFWIYEPRLLSRLMKQSLEPGSITRGPITTTWNSSGTSFLDAWLEGGQVSDVVLWSAWLVQNLLDGKLKDWSKVDYQLVTVPQTSVSLARVFSPESYTTWAPSGDDLLLEAAHTKTFSWEAFGKYWYDTLGQAGIWGDYLLQYPLDAKHLKEFVASVPWCLSNCHHAKVQKQLSALTGGTAA